MNVRNALAVFGVLNMLAAATAQASTTLPYAQSFEGSFAFPETDWTNTSGGITVAATEAAHSAAAGTQGLIVSNATVTLEINNTTYDNAWIQIYAKPVKGSADPSVSGVNGAFYITSAGQLKAYSGGAWVNVGGATQFSANSYYGFIVHADYATDTWDIYTTAGAYKANMTLLNTTGSLLFTAAAGQLDNVSVDSGDKAYLDAVAVSRAFSTAGVSGDRVSVYEHAVTNASQLALGDFTLPAYASSYTNPVGNVKLGSQVGNAILSGLVAGDSIQVWSPTDGAFETYGVSGSPPAFDNLSTPNSINKTAINVEINTRLLLDPNNARAQTFGFYAYSNANVQAYSGVAQPPAAAVQQVITLNGTSDNVTGFTALNWVDADTLALIEIRDPDADLNSGDRLYVASPTFPNSFTEYYWDNAGNWRNFNGQIVSSAIAAGSKIWVKRQQAASEPITVTHN